MALILVFNEDDFSLDSLEKELTTLNSRFNFLYDNVRVVPDSAAWPSHKIATFDVCEPRFNCASRLIDYLVIELLEQLPSLFAYNFEPFLEADEIDEAHLARKNFRLALPY